VAFQKNNRKFPDEDIRLINLMAGVLAVFSKWVTAESTNLASQG
jgi:hypothetical protein